MSKETVAVSIAAASRLLREALSRILSKRTDLHVVSAVSSFTEAMSKLDGSALAVLLSDSVTAPLSEPQSIQEMLRCAPGVRLVLVGMDEDENLFLQAVRAGALGYLLKDASAWDLVAAVRAVAQGEAVSPPRLCGVLFNCVAQQTLPLPNGRASAEMGFTRREQQVIPLIAQGLTNKEIACELGLSEQTVKNHVHRIMRKAGIGERLQIVEVCRAQGWSV
jgi:DNA-binding NarL/FixJ family response regulator